MESSENIKVCVKCRPLSELERTEKNENIVSIDESTGSVSLRYPGRPKDEPPKVFTFDRAFDENSKQVDIFNLIARPVVDAVLDGYNGTILTYGQTDSGKTFTMDGVKDKPEHRGLMFHCFDHIFDQIAKIASGSTFNVRVSYLEICKERVRDLLATNFFQDRSKHVKVTEGSGAGFQVKKLTMTACRDVSDMERMVSLGKKNRSMDITPVGEIPPRSNAIFSVYIERTDRSPDGTDRVRAGKLDLVDLGRSNRIPKTGLTEEQKAKMTTTLSPLGNVIMALLNEKRSFVPYRDSQVTRLLKDALGGNSKTVMIANISPASSDCDETLATLRTASRAMKIKNYPVVNQKLTEVLLHEVAAATQETFEDD